MSVRESFDRLTPLPLLGSLLGSSNLRPASISLILRLPQRPDSSAGLPYDRQESYVFFFVISGSGPFGFSHNSTDLRVRGLGLGSLRIRRTTRSANTPFPAASCVVFRAVYTVRLTNGPFASDCFSLVRSRPTSNAVRFLRPVRSVPMRTSSTRRRVVLAPVVGTKLCALEDLCTDFRPTTLPYIFDRRLNGLCCNEFPY